jgi:uncharacterized protein DUF4304
MERALREEVRDELRPLGFRGSFPHLRRLKESHIELVSIQFHSAGGSFVIEVAACPPAGITTSWGKRVPPTEVTARDIAPRRPRLGSPTFPIGDHWFEFGPRNYEPGHDRMLSEAHFATIAHEAIPLVMSQAVPFWEDEVRRLAQR